MGRSRAWCVAWRASSLIAATGRMEAERAVVGLWRVVVSARRSRCRRFCRLSGGGCRLTGSIRVQKIDKARRWHRVGRHRRLPSGANRTLKLGPGTHSSWDTLRSGPPTCSYPLEEYIYDAPIVFRIVHHFDYAGRRFSDPA